MMLSAMPGFDPDQPRQAEIATQGCG